MMNAYVPTQNPHDDENGMPLAGQEAQSYAFAVADWQKWFDGLTSDEQAEVIRQRRNFFAHQNVSV